MKRTRVVILVLIALLIAAVGFRFVLAEIQIRQASELTNYTLLEKGLYMGGRTEALPPETGAVLCLSMERDAYDAAVYQWRPIQDGRPAPSLAWLREQVMFIDAQRKAGRTVYVHCDAGISRSGMVMAAYYMWREHWPLEKALAFLREKRKLVNPNQGFRGLLLEWEQAVAGDKARE